MAEDRDLTHGPGTVASCQGAAAGASVTPGAAGIYPESEAQYWRDNYLNDPYVEGGSAWHDYSPAYELGWVSYSSYGSEFEAADRVLANDWELRKGVSSLSWEQARPASRAAWQRAHNAGAYTTDGSAGAWQAIEALNDLLENAQDGELGFREAGEHTRTPSLAALFGRCAETCRQAAGELREQIRRLGGTPDAGGSVSGAAHRMWVQIRGLFGGASDETMLAECERGEYAAVARYREALEQNLPHDIHAMVQRHFEGAQRNHDLIKSLREGMRAQGQAGNDESA